MKSEPIGNTSETTFPTRLNHLLEAQCATLIYSQMAFSVRQCKEDGVYGAGIHEEGTPGSAFLDANQTYILPLLSDFGTE